MYKACEWINGWEWISNNNKLNRLHPLFFSFVQVLNGHQRNDGRIEDFCDAQIFKSHPLFARDPTALQLMLYYDEVEIANPLGSKSGKHKLGNFTNPYSK